MEINGRVSPLQLNTTKFDEFSHLPANILIIPRHLATAGFHTSVVNPDSTSKVFLNLVPVQFTISGASEHFHVPLLVAPEPYSTY